MKIRGAFGLVLAVALLLPAGPGAAASAPVGQLPAVAVSLTPTVYALPLLMVEKSGEWKDFGIQVNLRIHSRGEEQLARAASNEWEVGLMDPLSAVQGGNEGNVVIVGVAGNLSGHPSLSGGGSGIPAIPGRGGEWLKAHAFRPEFRGEGRFLPFFLVATENYADTRKTLVIRWMEGYFRGIQIIKKDPGAAALRLKEFYAETLNRQIPPDLIRQDIEGASFFDEKEQEQAFRRRGEKASPVEEFADAMTRHLRGIKALGRQAEPGEYILSALCDQLSNLRQEALAQVEKTRSSIQAASRAGARVDSFQKTWEEAKARLEEGRGCLAVIGVLSNLQRSADQARVDSARLRDFRRIETAVGGLLAFYYGGYFLRRRRKKQRVRRPA